MQAKLKNAVQALCVAAFVFASFAGFYQAGKIDGAKVAVNNCK
ncbi:hypothetical protein P26059A_0106 [Curvibacter phage P26059A]|nr:hypothetical protein P26059A_0106 [Curvibacter phage P26059A]